MGSRAQRRGKGRFVGLPYHVVSSPQFIALQPREIKLLIDLLHQYNGRNNGTLSATYTLMERRGWEGKRSSLYRAKEGLIQRGFAIQTRQGQKVRGYPTLLAITWHPIDEPKAPIEYDHGIEPSNVPLNLWKKEIEPSQKKETPKLKIVG